MRAVALLRFDMILTNCVFMSEFQYVKINDLAFMVKRDALPGVIALNTLQRHALNVTVDQDVDVRQVQTLESIESISISVDHLIKPIGDTIQTTSSDLENILLSCENRVFNLNQTLIYKRNEHLLSFKVTAISPDGANLLTPNTTVVFNSGGPLIAIH